MSDGPHTTRPDDASPTYHGAHTRAVDTKGRFNLPFRFRHGGAGAENERYMVARGPDGDLAVYPHAVWIANLNRIRQTSEPGLALRRNLRRINLASHEMVPDAQGRVMVPPEMLASVGISRKVCVVGVGAYMELWDPDALAAAESEGDLDKEFENAFFR